MKTNLTAYAFAAFVLCSVSAGTYAGAQADAAGSAPELVMTRFLRAFVAYDYDTCRSLLAPGATISITRSYRGGDYQISQQDARKWLDDVGESGVKQIEGFSVDIHETAALEHVHGATIVLKFTSSGMTGQGQFVNTGFDSGNLVETPDGWRILHYSSFEAFSWSDPGDAGES